VIERSDTKNKEKRTSHEHMMLGQIRKETEMTTVQMLVQRDRTEEAFVIELKTQSTQKLGQFLAGSWTASLLSPETIEELYQELQRRQAVGQEETEEGFGAVGQD
jgi:hypothetical protein